MSKFKYHKYDSNECQKHNCRNCKNDSKTSNEEPCNSCYNNFAGENCYWESKNQVNSGTVKRTLLVKTAQNYYESAVGLNTDGEVYSMSEKLHNMNEALNHTESALFAAILLLKEVLVWECQDDDNELDIDLKRDINEFVNKFSHVESLK